MSSNQHPKQPGIICSDNHDEAMRSNETNLPSSFQHLTSNRALNGEFVNNVLAREQRIQVLLGMGYSLSNSSTVVPNRTNNHLFNLADPGHSLVRHESTQRPLIMQSGHPLFGRLNLNQRINNSNALQLILRNQSQQNSNLQASTFQDTIPREDIEVTASKKGKDTSISQYLRSNLTDQHRLNSAPRVGRSSISSMLTNFSAIEQKPQGNDIGISQYLRRYSTDRQQILNTTPTTNVLNSLISSNSSVTKHNSQDNRFQVSPIQCHDFVAHSPPPKATKGRPTAFPKILYQVLLDLEVQSGGSSIASFLPHGRGFAIHKPEKFTTDVMPKYFGMSSFARFRRQLKIYNFQQIRTGPEKGSYYHELFVRGQPQLLAGIMGNSNEDEREVKIMP